MAPPVKSIHDEFDAAPSVHDEFDAAPAAPATKAAPEPAPQQTIWDHILKAATPNYSLGEGLNRSAINMLQGLPLNMGHRIFPPLFAAGDVLGDTLNGTPSSYEDNLRAERERWAGVVSPVAAGIGTIPTALALGQAMPLMNAFRGVAGDAAIQGLAEADRTKRNITTRKGIEDTALDVGARIAIPYAIQGLGWAAGQVERGASGAADWAGDGLRNLAGRLKVNSLHPVPTIAEDMANLPGGVAGVGRTLLDKGLGGLTKRDTAEQVAAALRDATAGIDRTAVALDATGAPGPDLSAISSTAMWRDAVPRVGRPLTRATGQRLGDTLAEYANIYDGQPRSFQEGLGFRRELDDAIYRNDAFGAHPELSDFAEALRPTRADVNRGLLDSAEQASPALAEQFARANLETRQLGLAARAADRSAGRGTGNHVISLKDLVAAGIPTGAVGAGLASGHGGLGVAGGAASWLAGKYGSQMSARSLYTLANLLESSPQLLGMLADAAAPAGRSLARGTGAYLSDLVRPRYQPDIPAAYAMGDER
jgi:hypothetical protein